MSDFTKFVFEVYCFNNKFAPVTSPSRTLLELWNEVTGAFHVVIDVLFDESQHVGVLKTTSRS